MSDRLMATIKRTTAELDVSMSLQLSPGSIEIATGIGFFDHMLTELAFHAGWSLQISCTGDLEIDDHHTVEDVGIALGMAFSKIVPSAQGFARFGYSYAPMDEALARAVLDISNRSYCVFSGTFSMPSIGLLSTCNIAHFFQSFAANARCTLHLDILRGENDHHKAEALFKAVALAFRAALAPSPVLGSTKGEARIDSELT